MTRARHLFSLSILVLFLTGCSHEPEKVIDFGVFESGVYNNRFFNLEVNIPDTWHVLDVESRAEITKKGGKIIAGKNKNLNAIMEAADLQNLNLLTASEHPMGAPVEFNPSFVIIAEKVKHLPGIVKGRDYHYHTKKLMESSAVEVSYPNEIYETAIDDLNFDVLEFKIVMGKTVILQKQYAAVINGYALLFVLTYSNEAGLESLDKIIQTIDLKA